MSSYNLRRRVEVNKKEEEEVNFVRRGKRKSVVVSDDEEESTTSDEEFIDDEEDADVITQELLNQFPHLSKMTLKNKVDETLEKFEEYATEVPKDELWKRDLSKKEVRKLEPQLKRLRYQISEEKPSIVKILNSKLPEYDKKRALKLFDILQNTQPYSEEKLNLEEQLQSLISSASRLNQEDIERIDKEEKKYQDQLYNTDLEMKSQIFKLNTDEDTRGKIYSIYLQMTNSDPTGSEYFSYRNKLKWALSLPYNNRKDLTHISLSHVMEILDSKLYGLKEVKEKILELVNNRLNNPSSRIIFGLEGPPGVGKTQIGYVIAEALGLEFERISLGGVEDPAIFKGHDNVYSGSTPSIILQILKKIKNKQGIILFDELDKLGATERGKAVQYALLHITDYLQNKEFQDSFLNEFNHDISEMWFMFTFNHRELIDSALLDRLDITKIPPYSFKEKIEIIKRFQLSKNVKELKINNVTISTEACQQILRITGGLRDTDQMLNRIISKIKILLSDAKDKVSYHIPNLELPYEITPKTLEYLKIEKPQDNSIIHSMYL